MRSAILALFVALGLGACKPRVTFQTYCDATGRAFCAHCAPMDPGGACVTSFVASCIGTREPNARTSATTEQMNACVAALTTAECATVAGGTIPPACNNR